MELVNEFRVSVPLDQAWEVLCDLERVAPCMPGAQLQKVEGDDFHGTVKVKVGPITTQYKGVAHFTERNEVAHRAVLRAEGRETRGQGNAAATVSATLVGDGDSTSVSIVTDLQVTGRVAQFGRGVLSDVSTKLLGQFVERLEADLVADGDSPAAGDAAGLPVDASAAEKPTPIAVALVEPPAADSVDTVSSDSVTNRSVTNNSVGADNSVGAGPAAPPTIRLIDSPEAAPANLMDIAGGAVVKRVVPAVVAVAVAVVAHKVFKGRRKGAGAAPRGWGYRIVRVGRVGRIGK